MVKAQYSTLLSYGLACVSFAIALGVSFQFRFLFTSIPIIPFLVAVMASARFGGPGPGLCTILFSFFALDYGTLLSSTVTANIGDKAQLVAFVVVSLLIVWLAGQRQKMAEALGESESRLQLLVTHNADGIIVVDEGGKILLTNPAAETLWGRSSEELRGAAFGFPLVAGSLAELDIPRRDEQCNVIEMRVVEMRVARTQWKGENVFLASLRDVTERKQLEETLRTINAKLEQRVHARTVELERVNADLKQLAYVSAHDLQEPVRLVAIYAQLLETHLRGELDASASEYLRHLREGVTHLSLQIRDLMRYTEIETLPQRLTWVDCSALLQRVLRTPEIQTVLQDGHAKVTYDDLPSILADEKQIELVFTHLIQNALTFRGAQSPRVHVSCSVGDQHWVFAIRDNGIGIDPQYAELIFNLYERLNPRKQYPGTGIGLSICKKVIERHKGRVWVESEPDKGATFLFMLPQGETAVPHQSGENATVPQSKRQ